MSILVPQQVPGRAVHMELEGVGTVRSNIKGQTVGPSGLFLGGTQIIANVK